MQTTEPATRGEEQLVEIEQYAIGGPLFIAVAAVTGAVMLVGFVAIEGVDPFELPLVLRVSG